MITTFHRITLLALCAPLAFASLSCNTQPELIEVQRDDTTTPSGIQVHDLLLGTGEAAALGDWLTVDYVARLTDRTEIDSSYDRGIPVEFQLGEAPVEGWNEGLSGMRAGGRRSLVIPAHLAFGEDGVPGRVPPGATVVYEMELVSVRRE